MSSNSQSSSSYSTFTSYSTSSTSSSTTQPGVQEVTGSRSAQTSYSDPSGSHTVTQEQRLGEPVVREERHYDSQGREMPAGIEGSAAGRIGGGEGPRIEDVTDADKRYEEAMEDEYAKREGGA
ncbi:uncharacterized protein LTR77_010354 [Saxophila tyrrhenica]|uniref:Uncharacterized protein n=1 Tax=Saxophila tyrrhenica TaxID=1690608 RepID=A0AAV9NXJ3_9PEZI|nr:hypothetical protein LTR77_010354 [Saxophila tyrrhenica]